MQTRAPVNSPTLRPNSVRPTMQATSGQLFPMEGDILLDHFSYSALTSPEKYDLIAVAESAFQSLWNIQDENAVSISITSTGSGASSGIDIHFTALVTNQLITGNPSSTAAMTAQAMKNEIDSHFFSSLKTIAAAKVDPSGFQAQVNGAQYGSVSLAAAVPTIAPTFMPSFRPTVVPTVAPSVVPTTSKPTVVPTTSKPTVVPTVVPTAVPTVVPTFTPTVGHLLTLTGDIGLNNVDYSSFSANDKKDFLSGAETALESLWHLNDGSVVVTADPKTTSRRLMSNAGVVLHFTITATDLAITGSSSSGNSAVTQSMEEKITVHFFAALQTSVAATSPSLQAAVNSAQLEGVSVSTTGSSSEDDKNSSSGPNLLVIILPVVLGSVFIVAVVLSLVYFFKYSQSASAPCSGGQVEVVDKKPAGTVGYAPETPVAVEKSPETAVALNSIAEVNL
jgi:hypothetical protein